MFEKKDTPYAEMVEKQLLNEGFECLKPSFDKKPLEMRSLHFQYLRQADYALIFSHLSNDRWIKTKIQDILKSPGMGRKKPWKTKLLVSGGKKGLETVLSQNAQIIPIHWEGDIDASTLLKITHQIQIKNER
jgi:hypothetical protein